MVVFDEFVSRSRDARVMVHFVGMVLLVVAVELMQLIVDFCCPHQIQTRS